MNSTDLLNLNVKHKVFGIGVITEASGNHLTIKFATRESKFVYPDAFEKFIIADDASVQAEIMEEINNIKLAAEAQRQAAEEARRIEENARLAALKAQTVKGDKKVNATKAYVPAKRIDGQPFTYLVFQGGTFDEESTGQFLWAPKANKDGYQFHHWNRMMDVREGDVILHCSNGYIKAISRAKGSCVDSAKPELSARNEEWEQWETDGRRLDCEYHILKNPIKHGDFKDDILRYCNVKYAPFDKDGNGNMGYLYDIVPELAKIFVKAAAKKNTEIIDLDFLRFLLV